MFLIKEASQFFLLFVLHDGEPCGGIPANTVACVSTKYEAYCLRMTFMCREYYFFSVNMRPGDGALSSPDVF